ncbi:DUF3231 family protein [Bacillus sp. 1NLA3E]|uniref:DUF3231 family protein n=1 Tax=Bacillus sp. 1NLA3E TaxID=666686 RepID=UPI000304B916|nr:DUF3231 family protein [Bacillus sp. 1NLA3E]AGK55588.1 hypothetical protein B1NLA3E_19220 [Bacillus sp. 1NLA3E]
MAHFSETCTDPEIKTIIEETIRIAKNHMSTVEQLFLQEGIVVPEEFKVEKHVIPNAPKLFSDLFYITYVLEMCKFGVGSHTAGFTASAWKDVRLLYKNFIR